MSNLKEIRDRITSISSTMQMTNAMKMVSASKLKKSQNLVHQFLPYYDKIQKIFCNINKLIKSSIGERFLKNGNSNNILFIVISSNRGLCGVFNSLIIKKIQFLIKKKYFDKNIQILSIGQKVGDILLKLYPLFKNENLIWNNFNFCEVDRIIDEVISSYLNNNFYEVVIVYNHLKKFIVDNVIVEQLLPIERLNINSLNISYIFEPNQEECIKLLIPKILKIRLYKALLYSQESEHMFRMMAMHQATENAKFIKNQLLLEYNKVRQSAITKEILEIMSGANALEK